MKWRPKRLNASVSASAYTRNLFHLVPQIRGEEKYFDVSRQEIERELRSSGNYENYSQCELDDGGTPVTAKLRLNISCKGGAPTWSVALKLHSIRIDGIDHEPRFRASDGTPARGWHRHLWDSTECNAERLKEPLNGFHRKVSSIDDFLISAFQEMCILLNKVDHGNNGLPLF